MSLKSIFFLCCMMMCSLYSANDDNIRAILPEFEQLMQEKMKEAHVPGMAIAVIADNEVVFLKGFGVRKVGENQPITPETVFQIASLSKPLTSTVLAALVGEKIVDWDSRVNQLDPQFELEVPWVTSELTLKDLLSHRSGLPDHAGDLLEDLGFDQKTIFHKLRLEPIVGFRAQFLYTNFGFSEAAIAAAKAANTNWDTLVQQKLFTPLGMASAAVTFSDYIKQTNRAEGHVIQDGNPQPLYQRNPDAQSPAGGMSMNLNDFTKWMLLQLSGGQYDGKQIIPEESLKQTYVPAITKGNNSFYGLGWIVYYNERGHTVISHSGGFALGAGTFVQLIPEEKFGIAVFTNRTPDGFAEAVGDIFHDLKETGSVEKNWLAIWKERFQTVIPKPITSFPFPKNRSGPLPLNAYTGSYQNDYFDAITVFNKEGKLYLSIGPKPETVLLTPLNRDAFYFQMRTENISDLNQVIFTIDGSGLANQLVIDVLNQNGHGTFTRFAVTDSKN